MIAITPLAYLNWVAFDGQFNMVNQVGKSGAQQVPTITTGQTEQAMTDSFVVEKSGYIYIYVSNESSMNVFFDNLVIHHHHGPLLQEDHFYPYGLSMAAISDQAILKPENKFKYNGEELQHKEFSDGTGLEEYDYGARMFDPQLGRWGTLDPMAEGTPYSSPYTYVNDNPIDRNDPNGMWWEDKKASDQANKIESEVNKVNSKIEARIHKQLARADQQAARGNTKKALKIVAKIDINQARVEINNKTIGALHDMRDAPYMAFNFSTNSTTVTNTDETGTTTTTTITSMSRTSNGVYVINNSGDLSNQAHEITHGGQVANGLVSLTSGTNNIAKQTIPRAELEVEAYKANFGITGSIPIPGVNGINDPDLYNKVSTFIYNNPSN